MTTIGTTLIRETATAVDLTPLQLYNQRDGNISAIELCDILDSAHAAANKEVQLDCFFLSYERNRTGLETERERSRTVSSALDERKLTNTYKLLRSANGGREMRSILEQFEARASSFTSGTSFLLEVLTQVMPGELLDVFTTGKRHANEVAFLEDYEAKFADFEDAYIEMYRLGRKGSREIRALDERILSSAKNILKSEDGERAKMFVLEAYDAHTRPDKTRPATLNRETYEDLSASTVAEFVCIHRTGGSRAEQVACLDKQETVFTLVARSFRQQVQDLIDDRREADAFIQHQHAMLQEILGLESA